MTDDDKTRLYVATETREDVNAHRRGGETQDDVVRRALDALDGDDDVLLPGAGSDIDTEAFAEELAAKLREVREMDSDELTPLEEAGGDPQPDAGVGRDIEVGIGRFECVCGYPVLDPTPIDESIDLTLSSPDYPFIQGSIDCPDCGREWALVDGGVRWVSRGGSDAE